MRYTYTRIYVFATCYIFLTRYYNVPAAVLFCMKAGREGGWGEVQMLRFAARSHIIDVFDFIEKFAFFS